MYCLIFIFTVKPNKNIIFSFRKKWRNLRTARSWAPYSNAMQINVRQFYIAYFVKNAFHVSCFNRDYKDWVQILNQTQVNCCKTDLISNIKTLEGMKMVNAVLSNDLEVYKGELQKVEEVNKLIMKSRNKRLQEKIKKFGISRNTCS